MIPSRTGDLVRVRLSGTTGSPIGWADGLWVSIPRSAIEDAALHGRLDVAGTLHLDRGLPAIDPCHAEEVRRAAVFTCVAPRASRLPISYRLVPGPIRRAGAGLIGRALRHRLEDPRAFPAWPLDLSADVLEDWAGSTTRSPGRTPVILTHDIDSPAGLKNLVRNFLPVEESVGARSTNFIVPCAWKLDEHLLGRVCERGHELGIHGYDHSNRTPFAAPDERLRRLDAAHPLVERYRMRGYRAPSLLRTQALLHDLAGRFAYDSSVPTSGGVFPVPDNGCASARPFKLHGIAELPISLPRDGSLQFLGYRPDEILDLWKRSAASIARAGGVVVLLTHCESHFSGSLRMLTVYREFLSWLAANSRFALSSPGAVLASKLR